MTVIMNEKLIKKEVLGVKNFKKIVDLSEYTSAIPTDEKQGLMALIKESVYTPFNNFSEKKDEKINELETINFKMPKYGDVVSYASDIKADSEGMDGIFENYFLNKIIATKNSLILKELNKIDPVKPISAISEIGEELKPLKTNSVILTNVSGQMLIDDDITELIDSNNKIILRYKKRNVIVIEDEILENLADGSPFFIGDLTDVFLLIHHEVKNGSLNEITSDYSMEKCFVHMFSHLSENAKKNIKKLVIA